MAELDSLIGSKISLISQQDIRYEGIFHSINSEESSIMLKDVRCHGTEDRATAKPVAAKPDLIALVKFPGSEIKDLIVVEEQLPAAPEPKKVVAPPPAPEHEKTQGRRPVNEVKKPYTKKPEHEARPVPVAPRDSSSAGTGAHLLHLRVRKDAAGKDAIPTEEIKGKEFDFQAALTSFSKLNVKEDGKEAVAPVKAYKQQDFFDNLSCDVTDRTEGKATRMTSGQERVLNQDTFGAVALQSGYRRNYRGGRGGRGSGGRGRGGGRQRGFKPHTPSDK